jgi:uncharacterized protein YndB with AHSA1/START domain
MTLKIERTFEVPVPVERAWSAMTDPAELSRWYFPFQADADGKAVRTEIQGGERESTIVGAEPLRFFHTRTQLSGREGFAVSPGTRDMHVSFEPTETGTRVTVVHSGWPDTAEGERDRRATEHGSGETISDLILYLRTGVPFPRHHRGERCDLGIAALDVPGGLEVCEVEPGSFADRLGLEPGDLLVELDGAGVFGFAEVCFFMKLRAAGDKAEARWLRDGKAMHAVAELGGPPIAG